MEAHLQTCVACREMLREQTEYAMRGLAAQITPAPEESRHLDDAQILAAARGGLDDADHEAVVSHLDLCADCARAVEDMREFHLEMNQVGVPGFDRALMRPSLHERVATFFADINHALHNGSGRLLTWWHDLAINGRLFVALIAGVLVGLLLRGHTDNLQWVGSVFMRVLEVVATLFIFVAIVHTLLRVEIGGRTASRLGYLAFSNTLVAIGIGLLVGNVARPGARAPRPHPANGAVADVLQRALKQPFSDALQALLSNPLLLVVLVALALGVTLRLTRQEQIDRGKEDYKTVEAFVGTLYHSLILMLNGVVLMFPLAVFAIVAWQVGHQRWGDFVTLLWFSLTVLIALSLQFGFYLTRLWLRAAIRPGDFLHSGRHALLSAFSTASSILTLPITYTTMRDRKDVSERSASLGVLVGGHFNRDGTALYEAITPVFIAQATGHPLNLTQQAIVGLMAIVASIAAPGLPNTGLITMALVFRAVGLDTKYIFVLPIVDWFLDRCRTMINVMGTMTIACLLEKRSCPHSHTGDGAYPDEPNAPYPSYDRHEEPPLEPERP